MFKEFGKFIARGSVLDLAVGIIIGAAFTAIVNSLVKDIIMPPIGYLLNGVDFSNLFIVLGGGTFASLADAEAAGAATINYGLFINALINFLIVAVAVFFLIKSVNTMVDRMSRKEKAAAAAAAAAPAGPTTEEKLVEALDRLTTVLENKE
jgi:large conductance mechanosensitive channel